MEDRDAKINKLQDEIETNLQLIGATAIEDLLQEDVSKLTIIDIEFEPWC